MEGVIKSLKLETQQMLSKSSQMLNKAKDKLHQAIEDNLVLQRFKSFSEEYKFKNSIETLYQILDAPQIKRKSAWTYTSDDI